MAADSSYMNKELQSLTMTESGTDTLNDQPREKHCKANSTIMVNDPVQNANKGVYGDKIQE